VAPTETIVLKRRLPELLLIKKLAKTAKDYGQVNIEGELEYRGVNFPLYSFRFGNPSPEVPSVTFVAGVHGVERIGTRILIAYLSTVCSLLSWDKSFQNLLKNCRLQFYPMVNPGGMYWRRRANPNGVDLMRNAPIDADHNPTYLVGGHRFTRYLPWFRGKKGAPLEQEIHILSRFIREHACPSKVSLVLDVHSGFGTKDRLWFPYAKSVKPFPSIAEIYALKELLDRTYPNHVYVVEPQSTQYTTHGDLWDYIYDEHLKLNNGKLFLPLSLELGSWIWVKKNPRQALSALGAFNPIVPHRRKRVFRRHLLLFEFLLRAVNSSQSWTGFDSTKREDLSGKARTEWYGKN